MRRLQCTVQGARRAVDSDAIVLYTKGKEVRRTLN